MFDVAFSEIVVIAVVALVVIGPEKLPKVARTLGLLAGRAQRYINSVKTDIEREIRVDELRRLEQDAHKIGGNVSAALQHEIHHETQEIDSALRAASGQQILAPLPEKAEHDSTKS